MTQHKLDVVIELLGLLDKLFVVDDPAPIRRRVFDELLADDLVYQNHPQRVTHGKREFASWQREFAGMQSLSCEVRHAAVDGDWVLTERVDTWTIDGIAFSAPLMGSFEVRADGRVHSWLDYLPYTEVWRGSGQLRSGFFDDWASSERLVSPAPQAGDRADR